ncbi:MAG: hypothetical protein PV358_12220, partial [Acidimicrobiales bacterium]|nr:hypothetical protein [Acidimicrobiales bacterium]
MDTPPRLPDSPLAPGVVDVGAGGMAARLERWAADARVDEAARARSRERWLRRQAEDETSLAGVAADLRDAATSVTVGTRSGRRHAGAVRVVGEDFVVVGPAAGRGPEVVVALAALESVRTLPGVPAVVGDRPVEVAVRLVDVVIGLAEERRPVQVVTVSGDVVGGVVAAVGLDVLTVRSTERPASVAYVPLA